LGSTPETKHPSKPVQCFGKEASARAEALPTGRKVWIQYDTSQDHRDRYSRDLVYRWLDDHTMFNEVMVREGFAHEYTYDLAYRLPGAVPHGPARGAGSRARVLESADVLGEHRATGGLTGYRSDRRHSGLTREAVPVHLDSIMYTTVILIRQDAKSLIDAPEHGGGRTYTRIPTERCRSAEFDRCRTGSPAVHGWLLGRCSPFAWIRPGPQIDR
jgi:hypothetical protein